MRPTAGIVVCFALVAACGVDKPKSTHTQIPDDTPAMVQPVAVIEADTLAGPLPLAVSLSGAASEGDDLSWLWTFADGSTASGVDVQRTWLGSGSYEVDLTVTDGNGAEDTATVDVEVAIADCPESGAAEAVGMVIDVELDEISGLGVSHANPGVLWVHNDARNRRALYALDELGNVVGDFGLEINYGDWEDIAVGEDAAGEPVLYIGSVGNNDLDRLVLAILIVAEPVVPIGELTTETLEYREMQLEFPDGPYDSESLMWDPQTGDLYVVTKDPAGASIVFRAAAPHDEDLVVLEQVATLDFAVEPLLGIKTTAAAISPLGDQIAIRTYSDTAFIWRRDASATFTQAFETEPCPVTIASETQGESLDFSIDGDAFWTIPEGAGAPVNHTEIH